MGWQWHHMQIICTLLQTDSHATTSSRNFLQAGHCLTPNQQCQSTEGTVDWVAVCRHSKSSAALSGPQIKKKNLLHLHSSNIIYKIGHIFGICNIVTHHLQCTASL